MQHICRRLDRIENYGPAKANPFRETHGGLASAAAPEPAVKPTGAAASAGKTVELTELKNTGTRAIRDPLAGADPKILEKFCLVKGGTYKKVTACLQGLDKSATGLDPAARLPSFVQ